MMRKCRGEFTTQSLGVAKEALERWNWEGVSLELLNAKIFELKDG